MANSSWMVTEFIGVENDFYGMGLPGKSIAAVFFVLGIAILLCYYTYRTYKWMADKKQLLPVKNEELEKV